MTTAASAVKAAPSPRTKHAVLHRKCTCGRTVTTPGGECEECARKRKTLRRSALARGGRGPAPSTVHDTLRSPGQPLEPATRAWMEQRFAVDFGRVRIHADDQAAGSARAVSARAYSVGSHIAFGAGEYATHREDGRSLLAHELAHVALEGAGPSGDVATLTSLEVAPASSADESAAHTLATRALAGGGMPPPAHRRARRLYRAWDPPGPHECDDVGDKWLKKVVVDQEPTQFVTLHWSDGSLETAGCSTGKGHCCTTAADGVACDHARSRTDNSNCTPISHGAEFSITDRLRVHNGWNFWNTFVPTRGIALHEHNVVDGTPLSHGCVRLPLDTARHIFCGAQKENKTRVEVRGYARPLCTNARLPYEWKDDIRHSTDRTQDGEDRRRILHDGYGRDLTALERTQLLAGTSTLPFPPPCPTGRTAAGPNVEEASGRPTPLGSARVVPDPTGRGPGWNAIVPPMISPSIPQTILEESGFESSVPAFIAALNAAPHLAAARLTTQTHGRRLWQAATARAQGATPNTDDRPLYWARLEMSRAVRGFQPAWALTAANRAMLLDTLEASSRGRDTVGFAGRPGTKRILISGFDPFGGAAAGRGNPSGAAALALDGQTLSSGTVQARVEAVIFPVRFADFDAGAVETFFRPFLTGASRVDMVMTVSQGGSAEFEVEEFAGRRRDTGVPDNLLVGGGGAGTSGVVVPPGLGAGPEFLRTTLPPAVRAGLRSRPLPGETEFTELPPGATKPVRRTSGTPTPGATAVEGSGGSFLSNEIFYRTRLLKDATGSTVPMGHLHTPLLAAPSTPAAFTAARDAIVARIRKILVDTIPSL